MSIFRVPGDFVTIETALQSPMVQRGDTILVKDGSYNKVVVVPFRKIGIHIRTDHEQSVDAAADESSSGQVLAEHNDTGPGVPPEDKAPESDPPSIEGSAESLSLEQAGRDEATPPEDVSGPSGGAAEPPVQPADDAAAVSENPSATAKKAVPPAKTGRGMIRMRQGSVSPYWMLIRRRTVERS